jgi:hypothetical protein
MGFFLSDFRGWVFHEITLFHVYAYVLIMNNIELSVIIFILFNVLIMNKIESSVIIVILFNWSIIVGV